MGACLLTCCAPCCAPCCDPCCSSWSPLYWIPILVLTLALVERGLQVCVQSRALVLLCPALRCWAVRARPPPCQASAHLTVARTGRPQCQEGSRA